MKPPYHLELPTELESIRPLIENSLLPIYKLLPFSKTTSLFDSKFSGSAYFPYNITYPKDIDGCQMAMLAQINFTQLNMELPFPKEGILQFFISPSIYRSKLPIEEHLFQHYFKVRYYPQVLPAEKLNYDVPLNKKVEYEPFPIGNEMALLLTHTFEPVSAMDYRVERYLKKPLSYYSTIPNDGKSIEDLYLEHYLGAEHKIGGYPYFIYDDTRKSSPFLRRFDTLLLQIVSNDAQNIMWGDSGIIKFFINEQKLMNLDFSDIYFIAEQYE